MLAGCIPSVSPSSIKKQTTQARQPKRDKKDVSVMSFYPFLRSHWLLIISCYRSADYFSNQKNRNTLWLYRCSGGPTLAELPLNKYYGSLAWWNGPGPLCCLLKSAKRNVNLVHWPLLYCLHIDQARNVLWYIWWNNTCFKIKPLVRVFFFCFVVVKLHHQGTHGSW